MTYILPLSWILQDHQTENAVILLVIFLAMINLCSNLYTICNGVTEHHIMFSKQNNIVKGKLHDRHFATVPERNYIELQSIYAAHHLSSVMQCICDLVTGAYMMSSTINTMNSMYCLHSLVNVKFQKFNSQFLSMKRISIAPAHFYVLCGLLLECPSEPRSERVVTATASMVAVLSVPESVVGEPSPSGGLIASGRFTIKILSHKWWWAGSWVLSAWTVAIMLWCFFPPCCICPNMFTTSCWAVCDGQPIHIGMVSGVLTVMLVIPKCTWVTIGEPSSLPTHMLVAEVVGGEDHRVTCCWRRTSWPTHPLSRIQFILCEKGGAVDGWDVHVDMSHPHESPHTTLISLHVAVHEVRLCSIGDPVVTRWGWRVAVKNWTAGGGRSVSRPPQTQWYCWVGMCLEFFLSH